MFVLVRCGIAEGNVWGGERLAAIGFPARVGGCGASFSGYCPAIAGHVGPEPRSPRQPHSSLAHSVFHWAGLLYKYPVAAHYCQSTYSKQTTRPLRGPIFMINLITEFTRSKPSSEPKRPATELRLASSGAAQNWPSGLDLVLCQKLRAPAPVAWGSSFLLLAHALAHSSCERSSLLRSKGCINRGVAPSFCR